MTTTSPPEVAAIESDAALDERGSRLRVTEAIKCRYTGPA